MKGGQLDEGSSRVLDRILTLKRLEHVPVVRIVHLREIKINRLLGASFGAGRTSLLPSVPCDSSRNVGDPSASSSPFRLAFA